MVVKTEISNIDEVEQDLIDQGKMKESGSNNHYVNNKELYQELIKYHATKMKALENDEIIPPLTDKIGMAILQICERRCNSRMYVGYTNNWKEEMIGNAIEKCTLRGHNFDPAKSENPFAYFTQIADNAIKEQLKNEKSETYVKYKSIDKANGFLAETDDNDNDSKEMMSEYDVGYEDRLKFIDDFERKLKEKAAKYKESKEQDQGIFRE